MSQIYNYFTLETETCKLTTNVWIPAVLHLRPHTCWSFKYFFKYIRALKALKLSCVPCSVCVSAPVTTPKEADSDSYCLDFCQHVNAAFIILGVNNVNSQSDIWTRAGNKCTHKYLQRVINWMINNDVKKL